MSSLPQLMSGELKDSTRFSLTRAGLTEFPREIFALADTLEVLDLCDNQLSSLPDDFSRFKRLKAVFLFNNAFEHLPEVLGECPELEVLGFRYNQITHVNLNALPDQLRWLILTGNKLTHLPPGLGRFQKLQKCMLAGNRLAELPEDMQRCESLELLRISSNQLTELPQWLVTMPALSWLAYAGNPFCEACKPRAEPASQPTTIPWSKLHMEEELGQGASGNIFKATWQPGTDTSRDVAVKIFKGDMTSDGSPEDERCATMLAGHHKYLVPLIGRITEHPQSKKGLVFDLIPETYRNMAGPPSLASCTRDTYPEQTSFSVQHTLKIATALASVCQHLHERGILHGDFYPHNVLLTNTADTLITDFGAACFFDPANTELANGLQQLEVRAFACALDDMLARVSADSSSDAVLTGLNSLLADCMQPNPKHRPLFKSIALKLQALNG